MGRDEQTRLAAAVFLAAIIHLPTSFAEEGPSVAATGDTWAGAAPIDELMRSMIAEHQAVGIGVAVAKDGRLAYSRGFGFADRETKELVQPESLFRIASVSKPITAVAILRLVEQKTLSLDDKVFEVLGLGELVTDKGRFDARWKQVTIRHLLTHTGGWDRQASFDPMFQSVLMAVALGTKPPASARDIIRFMLGQPLDFDPGARYVYSNFGYNLLGRVLEKKTGKSYEAHIREDLLAPIGITSMRIGSSLETAPGEVHYHQDGPRAGLAVVGEPLGRRVEVPYGTWYQESLDAHGGWIASAVDLVRFGCSLRHSPGPLLKAETMDAMLAPPEGPIGHLSSGKVKSGYYGLGWMVKRVDDGKGINHSHNGSLPGTSTILLCSHDGFVWSVLFNSRTDDKGRELAPFVEAKMLEAIAQVKDWPEGEK